MRSVQSSRPARSSRPRGWGLRRNKPGTRGTKKTRRAWRRRNGFRAAAVLLLTLAMLSSWFGTARPTPATGSSAGLAAASFATAAFDPCAPGRLIAPRELRGMWLTTVSNADWPSKPGLSEDQVKTEYLGWLDLAVKLHHNAIFVHVRPSGDA